VAPETLVGICTERSLEMIIGLLGTLKAAEPTCRLIRLSPSAALFMLEDAQVRVLLTQERLLKKCHRHG
jgi:non-ribosomal peptide synthetase component F